MSPVGEILRSSRKDEQYVEKIRTTVTDVMTHFVGPQAWRSKDKWTEPFVRLVYYSVTTLCDYQTLGEEYTSLVQTTGNLTLPSRIARLVCILLKSFGTRLIEFSLEGIQKVVVFKDKEKEERLRLLLLKSLGFLDALHTCIFYYKGVYNDLAKRLTGIKYVKAGKESTDVKASFRLLGHIATLHLLLSLSLDLLTLCKHHRTKSLSSFQSKSGISSQQSSESLESSCSLCLDTLGSRGGTATTFCGHLGCWTCLLEVATISGECPLCRAHFTPNKIVPVHNL